MRKILLLGAFLAGCWAFLRQAGRWIVVRPNVERTVSALPPADEAFSARNPQGAEIAAWWYRGGTGAGTVLLCHGYGSRHEKMIDIVAFLRKAGYALLLLDFRAHGKSGGIHTSIGLQEWEDVSAVLSEAERRGLLPPEMPLAAFGVSMGAATLVNGAQRLPRIRAFLLESMYCDFRTVAANYFRAFFGIPDCFLIDLIVRQLIRETGYDFWQSQPAENLKHVFPRPLLLIQNTADNRVPEMDFDRLARNAPWATVAKFDRAPHVGAHPSEPARFEREFLGFLESAGVPAPHH